jgi:hypothetical protein
VSYLIRCLPANMAQCPAFNPVSILTPPSRYNVRVDNTASGYSLNWQVPLNTLGCNCSTAAVAVRASGTFVCNNLVAAAGKRRRPVARPRVQQRG